MLDELSVWEETCGILHSSRTLTLHPYQEKLVNGCREAFRTGKKRIIAYLPTGGGKTCVAIGIVKMAQEKSSRVAFLCNRVQLIEQTSHKFDEYGIKHGVIQGANTRMHDAPVIVGSIQTLDRRGMDDYDLIIVDECHACAGTEAYQRAMEGKRVIGLTATPYQRGLGRHLQSLGGPIFEQVVAGVTMRELIDDGYLVDADVWAPADPDLTGVRTVAGDYQEEQLGQAMDKAKLVGDIVDHWMRLSQGRQTMVFAASIAHSQHICKSFQDVGVNAVHVDYRMDDAERSRIYADFRNGQSMILCNCALLSEGADFPECSTLILARPTKSKVRYVQMFGRVLRTAPNKGRSLILDHSGTVVRLGFPWDFSVTHLDDGKPKKSQGEAQDKPDPVPKKCPKCQFVKPVGVSTCPQCGFKPQKASEVETEDGNLVQLRGKPTAQRKLQDQGKASVFHQLCLLASERKKSDSWVKSQYKAIFGTWPRQEYALEYATPELMAWIQSRNIAWAKAQRGSR